MSFHSHAKAEQHQSDWSWLVLVLIGMYAVLCPYTKVEESFNMQAIHDLVYFGPFDLAKYDHLSFPGVVPRTFIGPIMIAALVYPVLRIAKSLLGAPLSKFHVLLMVRVGIGLISYISWKHFHNSVRHRLGQRAATWFSWLTMSQFHPIFYASRSLPNTFATMIVNLSMSYWLNQQIHIAIGLLTFGAAIFRFELAILLGAVLLAQSRGSISRLARCICLVAGIAVPCIMLSVAIDSYFWKYMVWPEGTVFWFNIVQNQSSKWGTLPWHWYVTKGIPSLAMLAYPLSMLDLLLGKGKGLSTMYGMPAILFLALFSILPHKEVRFLLPIVSTFNLVTKFGTVVGSCILKGAVLLCLGSSIFRVYISTMNYPGAVGLEAFNRYIAKSGTISAARIHIDSYSATTGVSRFLEEHDHIIYDKTEGLTSGELSDRFDFLSSEDANLANCTRLYSIAGYVGMKFGTCWRLVSPQLDQLVHIYACGKK